MKRTLSLLIAGLTLSAFMIGCSKPEEGDNAAVTPAGDSKTAVLPNKGGATTTSGTTGTTATATPGVSAPATTGK